MKYVMYDFTWLAIILAIGLVTIVTGLVIIIWYIRKRPKQFDGKMKWNRTNPFLYGCILILAGVQCCFWPVFYFMHFYDGFRP